MDPVLQVADPRPGVTFADDASEEAPASLDASSAWLRELVFEAVRAATPDRKSVV